MPLSVEKGPTLFSCTDTTLKKVVYVMYARITAILLLMFFLSFPALTHSANFLKRRVDAVVLQGSQLEGILGADLNTIAVYAVNERGKFQSIAYQVDEKFPSDDYIFIPNKLPDTGRLSAKDELIFMVRDAGFRAALEILPFAARVVKEIQITDSISQERAWIYVVASSIPLVANLKTYVRYDDGFGSVFGDTYFFGLWSPGLKNIKNGNPWQPLNRSVVLNSATNEKEFTPNVLEKSLFQVRVEALGGLLKWDFEPQDIQARYVGHKIGPIRMIRKTRLRPQMGLGFTIEPITLIETYYDQYMTTFIDGDWPSSLAFASRIEIKVGEQYSRPESWKTPVQMETLARRDGKMDSRIVKVEFANQEALDLWRWQVSEKHWLPPQTGSVEFDCQDCLVFTLKGRDYPNATFTVHRYFPPNGETQTINSFLNIIDAPLKIRSLTIDGHLVLQSQRKLR